MLEDGSERLMNEDLCTLFTVQACTVEALMCECIVEDGSTSLAVDEVRAIAALLRLLDPSMRPVASSLLFGTVLAEIARGAPDPMSMATAALHLLVSDEMSICDILA